MAQFVYTAIDQSGSKSRGSLMAENRTAAMDQMLAQGLHPVELQEGGNGAVAAVRSVSGGRVPSQQVETFTRELSNLLAGGVPLSRALALLKREASHAGAARVWGEIHEDVIGGMPLNEALAKHPQAFSHVYVAMVRAGEAGGFLDLVLGQIADFRTRERDLLGKVKAALVYPIVLAVMVLGVLAFLLTWFIPRFAGMFADFGAALPWLTQQIVLASDLARSYGLIGVGVVVMAVLLVLRARQTDTGRRAVERAMLKMPGVGMLVSRFALVRFTRMLGTLLAAGVPLVASLRVAREAIGNQTLADAVSTAIEEVQRGGALARSLSTQSMLFPPSVVEMIAVAEETGRLDKELQRIALTYEGELDRRLRMAVSMAEPALLFVMAALVGTIVVGMVMPIFMLQDHVN